LQRNQKGKEKRQRHGYAVFPLPKNSRFLLSLLKFQERRVFSMKPIVIIGANAAGMSAASVIKRERKDLQVIVYGKGHYISYSA
jgi:hypothetical protein